MTPLYKLAAGAYNRNIDNRLARIDLATQKRDAIHAMVRKFYNSKYYC